MSDLSYNEIQTPLSTPKRTNLPLGPPEIQMNTYRSLRSRWMLDATTWGLRLWEILQGSNSLEPFLARISAELLRLMRKVDLTAGPLKWSCRQGGTWTSPKNGLGEA